MTSPDHRTTALRHLVAYDLAVRDLTDVVSPLPWDCDTPLVTMTRADIEAVLKRYVAGLLDAAEIEAWANLIECREDIAFDHGASGSIEEIFHELANPLLTEPLTVARARQLLLDP